MILKQLEEMGLCAEIAAEIAEQFEKAEAERNSLLEVVEVLKADAKKTREENEKAACLAAVEKEILLAGGRNVKAILALLTLEEVVLNGEILTGLDLAKVQAEAPYLFQEHVEKLQGTGYRGTNKKKNDISRVFKQALGR